MRETINIVFFNIKFKWDQTLTKAWVVKSKKLDTKNIKCHFN